jgi:hypothetical protein
MNQTFTHTLLRCYLRSTNKSLENTGYGSLDPTWKKHRIDADGGSPLALSSFPEVVIFD